MTDSRVGQRQIFMPGEKPPHVVPAAFRLRVVGDLQIFIYARLIEYYHASKKTVGRSHVI